MLKYLIENSTTEKTRLKTVNNHFDSLLDRTAKDVVHAKDKVGYALITAIGRIKSAVIQDINIYTLQNVISNSNPFEQSFKNTTTANRKRKHRKFELDVHPVDDKPSNPSVNLDTSMHAVENHNKIQDAEPKLDIQNRLENKLELVNKENKTTKEKN